MEDTNLRIVERTYGDGNVRYVIQKNFDFFGWKKWNDVSWDCSYATIEEAEEHIIDWVPKPKPIERIVKVY